MYFMMMTATFLVSSSAGAAANPRDAVEAFARAGDSRDLGALERVLHEQYRATVIMSGSVEPSFMSKADYLGLIRAKKIGGDSRRVQILDVDTQGDVAFARVRLTGKQATFESIQT